MKIGILSDTHDHFDHTQKAVDLFVAHGTQMVIHAGDFVNPGSVKLLEGMNLQAVLGNNDGEVMGLVRTFDKIGATLHGDLAEIGVDGLKVAVYHGTAKGLLSALIACGHHDTVISGHTHKVEKRIEGNTLVLNPGSAHGFGKKATVMILDTATRDVETYTL